MIAPGSRDDREGGGEIVTSGPASGVSGILTAVSEGLLLPGSAARLVPAPVPVLREVPSSARGGPWLARVSSARLFELTSIT